MYSYNTQQREKANNTTTKKLRKRPQNYSKKAISSLRRAFTFTEKAVTSYLEKWKFSYKIEYPVHNGVHKRRLDTFFSMIKINIKIPHTIKVIKFLILLIMESFRKIY